MDIQNLLVIGTGTMGAGIIEVAAVHGIAVTAVEVQETQRRNAQERITRSIHKGIERGKIKDASAESILDRILWSGDLDAAAPAADFVIEAISERTELKLDLFRRLDELCRPETILSSNTSSVSLTLIAGATQRPGQVVGMHFFNPVPVMAPVEIVRGLQTSDDTMATTKTLAERMGKRAFGVNDSPGFAVNRILMPLLNEAFFTLQEGVADAETIDALMKLGCNHPMGPLELADFIGLDICLSILQVLFRETGDPKFRPCTLLVRMVNAGRLGRKSGHGFYSY
ncbi:MAG: 3-hydroxyacyl-CoA dehydrogenase NAD-binding domain-containing protein [Planctomycetota bacterium]|nr:3-hydroxyacyl-CoA dehydrogenase NAD-binding domain-containing protein [Planctomycetota bacterium]MDA1211289.1 3-hydroxyacyl-CoA dehydrogenase NAD-binding domain-containing protein [Planctomycetota bacterium]